MKEITALTVTYNSKELIQRAYESFRKFHPDMKIIIVDGSDKDNPCRDYVKSIVSNNTTVAIAEYNIGHGRGMDYGIGLIETKYALIFDSDIEFIKSPVELMLDMMDPDTYAVGYMEKTGFDGYEYGAHLHHKNEGYMYMMHPFFHLLNIDQYYEFAPYVHHGAPCYKAALDIHNKGLTNLILKRFPGLGHTSGKGWCWEPVKGEYIKHDTAGTRTLRRNNGQPEIEQGWEY